MHENVDCVVTWIALLLYGAMQVVVGKRRKQSAFMRPAKWIPKLTQTKFSGRGEAISVFFITIIVLAFGNYICQ